MKQRNKSFAVFIISLLLSFSPVCAFAEEIDNLAPISITSGLSFDQQCPEATFDESRMIYGETVPFANVSVTVCRKDADGVLIEDYNAGLTVGSLGIFSMALPLELGTNHIEIIVNGKGYDEASYNFEIKRMPQKVKDELKNMMALPGFTQRIK